MPNNEPVNDPLNDPVLICAELETRFAGTFNAKLAVVAKLLVPNNDPVIPPPERFVVPEIINDPDNTVLPVTSNLSKLPVSV